MKPLLLPPNPIQHFYRGGDRIAALRGISQLTEFQPEEWLGSTVSRFGEPEVGPAITAHGPLADLVAADPESWVGGRGSAPADVGVLVKLLDARQRLPTHVHPGRAFAASHLDCPYGKTEAWFVLDAEPGSALYVGWKADVDPDQLAARRDAQDSDWLLSQLNEIPAYPGLSVLVPAGTAHAIGTGVFVAEVQEPTDFSILLEWSVTTSTREESHLDLGFDAVMGAVSHAALAGAELAALIHHAESQPSPGPETMLPAAADPYFRVLRGQGPGGAYPASFAVVIVTAGSGTLHSVAGEIAVKSGEAYAVPYAFGAWRVTGDAAVLACLPGAGWPASLGSPGEPE
ncbi:mannose-6-phosphate isomerase [Leucobacter exalbidus]|uniref:Mannose-6-phosphate isomerase n=1 Tax=Leucobacter exalbidus TaxID=662960 RepID=A0A940T3Y5_9MICO|nr:class I mannose-6-phosphate isomerase [Leucobacter exalbidus]MBP1326279.1 mannose-6-phosphate isomerase [Leucobacter exalbidus]